jgi:two-component system chemotaxis response regulator CheB
MGSLFPSLGNYRCDVRAPDGGEREHDGREEYAGPPAVTGWRPDKLDASAKFGPTTRPVAVHDFPVVCGGGSAGGLDAYIRLLRHLPSDLGVAVVIVNHLRHTATLLHEILPNYTKMPVDLITERLAIQPNRVFIIPPQRDLHVLHGEFRLKPISKPRGWPDVITVFLRSLAENWSGRLVAVIVSGFDGDGAKALSAIRDVGGVVIAQKLDTAKQPDMPESAIASGYVDFVLSPEEIAVEIAKIARVHTRGGSASDRPNVGAARNL